MWRITRNSPESKIVDSGFVHVKKTPFRLIWWRLNPIICKTFFSKNIESETSDEMKEFIRKENEIATKKMQDYRYT